MCFVGLYISTNTLGYFLVFFYHEQSTINTYVQFCFDILLHFIWLTLRIFNILSYQP